MKSGKNKKNELLIWERNLQKIERFKKKNGHCNVPHDFETDPSLALWVKNIRTHRNRLPDWVEKALLKLKFDFDYKPSGWDYYYKELKAFHKKHHHVYIPAREQQYAELYQWMLAVRNLGVKLSQLQRDSLDKLSFDWAPSKRDQSWELRIRQLTEFKREHGHVIIPKAMKSLNGWVGHIRKREKHISKERKEQLAALGFLWSGEIKKANDRAWEKHYQELVRFHRRHGHFRIPKATSLAIWCGTLRSREKYISKERKAKLDKIGFEWTKDKLLAREKTWDNFYKELVAFKKKHGHTSVPATNPKLYNWVATLKWRKRFFSEERIEKLDRLGFLWRGEFEPDRWEKRYEELKKFKKKYGHTVVPVSMKRLYLWCITLRQREDRVSAEHRKRLDSIGFRWSNDIRQEQEQRWQEKFNQLKAFYKAHGHCRVPEKETKLYSFLSYQRHASQQGTLKPEHRKLLQSIGARIDSAHK